MTSVGVSKIKTLSLDRANKVRFCEWFSERFMPAATAVFQGAAAAASAVAAGKRKIQVIFIGTDER